MQQYGLKEKLNHAAVIGLALTLFQLIIFLTGMVGNTVLGILPQLILGGLMFYFLKQARDKYMEGVMSYGKAFVNGISLTFFASLISAFYTYIHLVFINPNAVDEMLQVMYEKYQETGMSEDQIEVAMEMLEKFMTAEGFAITYILGSLFWGLIISLIVAAIVKKDGNPFANQTID